jgi:VanZ family protein
MSNSTVSGAFDKGKTEVNQEKPSTGRSSLRLFARAWFPVLVCVLVIAAESTPTFGADRTSGPLQKFFELFLGPFTQPQWWRFHHYVRKCGHFLGYGLLSISWFRAFWMTYRPLRTFENRRFAAHSLAMLGTLLVASSDEFHQIFLPNRTASIWDVLIDCCGGAAMQILIWLAMRRRYQVLLQA